MKKFLAGLLLALTFLSPASAEEVGWSRLSDNSQINDNVILEIDKRIAHTMVKVRCNAYEVVYAIRLDFENNKAIVDTIYEYVDGSLVNVVQKPEGTDWHDAVAPNEVEAMKFLRENAYKI